MKQNISQLKADYYKELRVRKEKLDKLEIQLSEIQVKMHELESQRENAADLEQYKSINKKYKDFLEQQEFINSKIALITEKPIFSVDETQGLRSEVYAYCKEQYFPVMEIHLKNAASFISAYDEAMQNIQDAVVFVNDVLRDNNQTQDFSFPDAASLSHRRQQYYFDATNLKNYRGNFS